MGFGNRKPPENYSYEITEIIGVISPQEDLKGNWAKAVIKSLMNETEEGIDIRRMNIETKKLGSGGIRLTREETNTLVDTLLEEGLGSFDAIEKAYLKRKALFEDGK